MKNAWFLAPVFGVAVSACSSDDDASSSSVKLTYEELHSVAYLEPGDCALASAYLISNEGSVAGSVERITVRQMEAGLDPALLTSLGLTFGKSEASLVASYPTETSPIPSLEAVTLPPDGGTFSDFDRILVVADESGRPVHHLAVGENAFFYVETCLSSNAASKQTVSFEITHMDYGPIRE